MSRILAAILIIIFVIGLTITGCEAEAPETSNKAPDFELLNLNGQPISLSSLQDKPVLLNFWATWCSPCRAEMPYIQEIHEEWSGKGLVVLVINIGENSSRVREFMESFSFSFPVLLDEDTRVSEEYNVRAIPTTFFIDKNGIIQTTKIGAFQSKVQIEKCLGQITHQVNPE